MILRMRSKSASFYASNRMVHAPLNKVLDLVKSDIQHDLLSALAEYKEATDKRIETMQKLIDELQSSLSHNKITN